MESDRRFALSGAFPVDDNSIPHQGIEVYEHSCFFMFQFHRVISILSNKSVPTIGTLSKKHIGGVDIMPFISKNPDAAPTDKQRLNLSPGAKEIIHIDMFTFGEKHPATFLNRIFRNYYEEAEASIARRLDAMEGELKEAFDTISNQRIKKKISDAQPEILDVLKNIKKKELVDKAQSYKKGENTEGDDLSSFTLNKDLFDYLTSDCEEDKYYSKSRGRYVKSVIEEYAALPYVERERVYYKSWMDVIATAIHEKTQLKITTGNDKIFRVWPHKLLCDPLDTANYLVGYSRAFEASDEYELLPCSFRISAIKAVTIIKSKSSFLADKRWKELEENIRKRGVQYMLGEDVEIHVRLTESGMNKYRRQVHLRPMLIRNEEDVYIFNCTKAQAEFYFFKFGSDAEILSPADLRDKFTQMYKDAAAVYHE